jgi:HAE1 family hydrophobic/amphiphilic exporter-1
MVMAIQFQSLRYPLIILMTIPLAFTGGLIALLIAGMNLSMVSLMGFIILIGIVVNNGIVLIDYINKLREQGYQVKEAIIEAGKTRLRPILMTALTTILALVMTAIGFGEGSELLQPMAVTAIGGLIYATILTLVVIPTIYALLNRKLMKKEALENANDQR